MRSEFEKLEDVRDILEDHKNIYFDSKLNMYATKKEETEDSVSYPSWEVTYLNGAWYVFQHQQSKVDELQKQRDSFIKAYEIEMDKSIELQKRVDAVKKLIQVYKDEEKELELKEWEQSTIYGRVAIELEQALKGGSNG